MQGKDALLLDALDRHEAHVRSIHGLADRLRVGRVGLVALDVGLYVLRWNKADMVPEPTQLSRPVVGARARLHPDYTWRELREERQQIGATQTTPENAVGGVVDTVHLENGLGDIKANRDDGHGNGSLRLCGRAHAPTSGRRTGAVHAIKWAVSRRYMSLESLAPVSNDITVRLPGVAA